MNFHQIITCQELQRGGRTMINFNKNKLINKVLENYYQTFSMTLDTADYVPEKYNDKIIKYIFKNMKKAFRKIDWEDFKYQRKLKKEQREKAKEIADSNKKVKSKGQQ